MGTKYTATAVTGYNATPPADDASQTAANQIFWSTIKNKLGDPLNTFASAIDTKIAAALDASVRQITTSDSTLAADNGRTVVIASTVSTGITVSLIDAATAAAGYFVTINNQSVVSQTIGRVTSANTINGTAANVTIPALSAVTLKTNSALTGFGIDGAASRGLELISLTNASASATIDFTMGITSAYDEYVITIADMVPATNTTDLWFRVSENLGVSFAAAASNYSHTRIGAVDAGGAVGNGSTGDTKLVIAAGLNSANAFWGEIRVFAPSDTSRGKGVMHRCGYAPSANTICTSFGDGQYIATTNAVNGFRLMMSSGNITTGKFALYGIRKS